ncbi:glycosyl hydrolase family 18 protein [Georgenia satyanarayanai]|uniref:glycoside hydrolase family 18 protein n=1 Tax=Georgenia satyanarayanai TaxID=860221 RepID=UPI00203EC159|nr:glycosyl hydrolase family 18 protein [Georgenia satyanarayanai]MCM3661188.1 glycosyl hydrolase family 18 protein [Georgenia satyanarayanai]
MTQRTPTRSTLALLAATGVLAGTALAVVPAAADAPEAPGEGVNGYRTLGYFPAWASADSHNYEFADLVSTGAADDLTHLNYAFGNVTTDLVCDISSEVVPEDGVDPGEPEGDPENDYLRLIEADDAVDGVADDPAQPLAGNFNQLRKLKERYPDLKVLISLGGWTWSDNFSAAALTPESRERLVDSCIDLYLDGNLPVHGEQGGPGVAAGIFDGFDMDWEWPAADGEHPSPNPEVDRENFLALMELFRDKLDERSAADGEEYLLTAFAPAGSPRNVGGWTDPRLAAVVDFLNVQGYDFHGGWVPGRTGHQGNLHPYEWPDGSSANWGLAADNVLEAYRAAGYRDDQLLLGLAAYGLGWEGVSDPTPGATASGALPGTNYSVLRDVGEEYFDETAVAAYRWDGDAWWSLDTPRTVTAKADWIADAGLGGAYFWDIAGDYDNELGSALAGTLRAGPAGPLAEQPGEPGEPGESHQRYGFFLTDSWRGGAADHTFMYGRFTDEVLIGDWDGDGRDSITVRRGNRFFVNNDPRGGPAGTEFVYGRPGDVVLVGDWNGDGRDTLAVRRGATYHVKNSLSGGKADHVIVYGRAGDDIMVGDWNGDGRDTFAVRRGATYHVKNSLAGGRADTVFAYGRADDATLAGDWDGDGKDTFAVRRGNVYHVSNTLRAGRADVVTAYGRAGDEVYVGDWNGDGRDTLGLRRTPAAAS